MADLNTINPELTNQLAADNESTGMTRRERRERAARMAAEAAKAAEEAQSEAEQAASPAEDAEAEAASEVVDLFSEAPLEADVIEDVASGIVPAEKADVDELPMPDEPTREYKLRSLSTPEPDASFLEEDEDEDDEDEDDDEEAKKPARREGRRRGRRRRGR